MRFLQHIFLEVLRIRTDLQEKGLWWALCGQRDSQEMSQMMVKDLFQWAKNLS